jgi:hypothetical protein
MSGKQKVLWLVVGKERKVVEVVAEVGRKYLKVAGCRFSVIDLEREIRDGEIIQSNVRAYETPGEANEVADLENGWEKLLARVYRGSRGLTAAQVKAALDALGE